MNSVTNKNIYIYIYHDINENRPYIKWINSIRDKDAKNKIIQRIDRLQQQGVIIDFNCKPLRGNIGIYELRFHNSPGYRVYFTVLNKNTVLILYGGYKSSQPKDIKKSQYYLADFKERYE